MTRIRSGFAGRRARSGRRPSPGRRGWRRAGSCDRSGSVSGLTSDNRGGDMGLTGANGKAEPPRWKRGSYADFLGLTTDEQPLVELGAAIAGAVREARIGSGLPQAALGKRIESGQSRIDKVETGTTEVSLDLMCRALFAAGGTLADPEPHRADGGRVGPTVRSDEGCAGSRGGGRAAEEEEARGGRRLTEGLGRPRRPSARSPHTRGLRVRSPPRPGAPAGMRTTRSR